MILVSACYSCTNGKKSLTVTLIKGGLDLGLAQIYPVWDEDTSEERMAVSASFADPYLAILRDDSTLLLLQADDSGDLDELPIIETINSTKWLSCCLYRDTNNVFSLSESTHDGSSESDVLLFLLSSDGKLSVSAENETSMLGSLEQPPDCMLTVLNCRFSDFLTKSYCQQSTGLIACSRFFQLAHQNGLLRARS